MAEYTLVSQSMFAGEPALEDMFADPIVRAVMAVDGLAESDLRSAVRQARRGLNKAGGN